MTTAIKTDASGLFGSLLVNEAEVMRFGSLQMPNCNSNSLSTLNSKII